MVTTIEKPVTRGSRGGQIAMVISNQFADWLVANGHAGIYSDLKELREEYRTTLPQDNPYKGRSASDLAALIAKQERRMEKMRAELSRR